MTGGAEAAQGGVVIGFAHDLAGDRLADEKKGHQGGDGTEDQQGHDLKVDSPLGARRCCPDAIHVAGAREDLTLSYCRSGRSERLPVGRLKSGLDLPQLEARFLPGVSWECQQIVVGRPYPTDLFFTVHTTVMYKILYARNGVSQGVR